MQVYEALVKGLESAGVETAFGGNGENIASLALALKHSRKIRPIMTRHEQAASFMACGYAMYTNRLGGICGADGYCVKTIEDFEDAFRVALSSGRPTVIDAKITRWAVPHYSTSPKGVLPGAWETLEERLRH